MSNITFWIDRERKVVRRSSAFVNLSLKFTRKVFLLKIKGLRYYAFTCPQHGWQVDYLHGPSKELQCNKCPFRLNWP